MTDLPQEKSYFMAMNTSLCDHLRHPKLKGSYAITAFNVTHPDKPGKLVYWNGLGWSGYYNDAGNRKAKLYRGLDSAERKCHALILEYRRLGMYRHSGNNLKP